ncbi:cell division cycle-associated 7-like protein [Cololabis saira]|uniref:cell division cycle-associated 7-like protein n=1 Tax=Cololabis saira TaxID=129043 RepID=UPI002AD529E4|nr:cell division cycle-associated 7-like protein [Cololabis saira]
MTLTSKAPCFKSKFITAVLAQLFSQSDSEEEFEGFSDEGEQEEDQGCFNKQLKTKTAASEQGSDVDTGFYSDTEEAPSPKRRSLLVALRFPVKRNSSPKQGAREKNDKKLASGNRARRTRGRCLTQNQDEDEKEEEEEEKEEKEEVLSHTLRKRDKNIQENKAMLAKLFADLSTMADPSPPTTPQKKQRKTPQKRKFEADTGSERRNPSRKARPPEKFAVEESEPVKHTRARSVDVRRLVEVDENHAGEKKKRKSYTYRRSQYVVRSVDEITEEDLENIAYRSKDKIWDKENGSSCHQCRQKTLDTKTVCRSGVCVGVKGQFCGPCLKNRYGEDVRTVLLDPMWSCPICRDMCNCSLCRKKEGRCATGILVGLARYNGHNNVHHYLESIQKELD